MAVENVTEHRRCPRCWAAMFEAGAGALSRTTRDDGAHVEVCPRCGTREGLYGYESANQPPLTGWPLSPDQLADEERRLIAMLQASKMAVVEISPDDARGMLGEDEPAD